MPFINRQTCQSCNRTLNANREGGFIDITTQNFICRDCFGQKLSLGDLDPEQYSQVNPVLRRPLIIAALAKIFFIYIFMTVGIESHDTIELMIGLILSLGLLVWLVIPFVRWINARKKEKKYQAWLLDIRKQARERREAEEKQLAEYREMGLICPHCGAYSKGRFCEYCGQPMK